jgi:hypothetical protein
MTLSIEKGILSKPILLLFDKLIFSLKKIDVA